MNAGSARPEVRAAVTIEEAILGRKSCRAFLPTEVPRASVERLLALASRAPSDSNVQPWKVRVVQGRLRQRISDDVVAAHFAGAPYSEDYQYSPLVWREPYRARRRKLGFDLYATLGIVKGDKEGMLRQHARNYLFFDAPVGLFFSLDRDQGQGAWIDIGAFMQTFMLAARSMGLATCGLQSFAKFHEIVARHLGIGDEEVLVCGMGLGFADEGAAVNSLVSERAPITEFSEFFWD